MKKIVVISDSFKGTLSSREICSITRETVPEIFPGCAVDAIPVADGGCGCAAALGTRFFDADGKGFCGLRH